MPKTNTEKQTTNIAVMQTDIGYIKKAIEGIEIKLDEMGSNFVKKEDLKEMVKVDSDHEIRIRFLERYVWLALGALSVATFALNYFKK